MSEMRHGIYEGADLLGACAPSFAALYRLWEEKCGGRELPARSDFDPVELKPWLGLINLIEVLPGPPIDFRYRLCGSETVAEYGADLTGKRFSEIAYAGTPAVAVSAMADFVARRKPRYRNDPIDDPNGYAVMRERLYLPLSSRDDVIDMVLCYHQSRILARPSERRR